MSRNEQEVNGRNKTKGEQNEEAITEQTERLV